MIDGESPHSEARIRPARPDEAAPVAQRLRAAIPDSIRPLTILGQNGVTDWIGDTITRSSSGNGGPSPSKPPTTVLVAKMEDSIRGAAEWRRYDDTLFLNGISVRPSDQNRGLGRRLLRRGLARFENGAHVSLDVFSSNVQAKNWYERLGFQIATTRYWSVCPLERGLQGVDHNSDAASAVSMRNKSDADTHHDRFGFSTLHFSLSGDSRPDSHHEVGRLGEHYFRITDPATVQSSPIRRALLELDRSRMLLYLTHGSPFSPSAPIPLERGECKARSFRMNASVPDVVAALSSPSSSR